jgi:hypothetical protein
MTTTLAPTKPKRETLGDKLSPAVIDACNRGDQEGLIQALGAGLDPDAGDYWPTVARRTAEMALEIRRGSIAVISNNEAFVRHTKNGSLHRVIRPVKLSRVDKTLYQIVTRKPFMKGTTEQFFGNTRGRSDVEWREVVLGDPNSATVTYPGYIAMNAVAGCAVGQPPTVVVDGLEKTNPYVERWEDKDGRKRDIVRIVLAIIVVGPAPETGNPVVVNYTLDYDPLKDLANMLDGIASSADGKDDCYLCPEEVAREAIKKDLRSWSFLPLVGNVGYLHNLRNAAVIEAYGKYVEIQANAMKKAQTVARRNAMKSHPALGVQAVRIDANGEARVPVTGWAGDERAMHRWTEIQTRLSQGQALTTTADDIEVMHLEERYDPDQHAEHGDAEVQIVRPNSETPELTPDQAARNDLIEQIDQGLSLLTPAEVAGLRYDPAHNTLEELESIHTQIGAMVDRKQNQ